MNGIFASRIGFWPWGWDLGLKTGIGATALKQTSPPRIALGQQYPMPCLEWSSERVEWDQGGGPKGPMSYKTHGWKSEGIWVAWFWAWEPWGLILGLGGLGGFFWQSDISFFACLKIVDHPRIAMIVFRKMHFFSFSFFRHEFYYCCTFFSLLSSMLHFFFIFNVKLI